MYPIYTNIAPLYCFTDGSKTSNRVGFAAVFGHTTIRGFLPREASIFSAELTAIKVALDEIKNHQEKAWTIFSDSQPALLGIKKYKPNHPIVQSIQQLLFDMTPEKKIIFCKVPSHVGVRGNESADLEAKSACELPNVFTNLVPHTDFYPYIKMFITTKWQSMWDTYQGKLKEIKPKVGLWPTYQTRQQNTIITRLRIGHSRLTHEYLLSRGRPPEHPICCNTPLTIKHLLLDCRKYEGLRVKHKLPRDLPV